MMHQILDNVIEISKELQFIERNEQVGLLNHLFISPFLKEIVQVL